MITEIVSISGWKRHRCADCGTLFRYPVTVRYPYSAPSVEQIRQYSASVAHVHIHRVIHRVPCPECGAVQSEMRSGWRALTLEFMLAPALGAIAASAFVFGMRVFPGGSDFWRDLQKIIDTDVSGLHEWLAWLAVVVLLVSVAALWLLVRSSPNRDLESNRITADQLIKEGRLVHDPWVPPNAFWKPRTLADAHVLPAWFLPVVLVAFALLGMPSLARMALGWKLNDVDTSPVAGPGDRAYVALHDSIVSLKGYWSGDFQTRVINADELGLETDALPDFQKERGWGDEIRTDPQRNNDERVWPWVSVKLPDDPELAGKTLELEITGVIEYPEGVGSIYNVQQQPIDETAKIQLASSSAGAWYTGLGFGCLIAAFLVVLAAALVVYLRVEASNRPSTAEVVMEPDKEPLAAELLD